MEFLARNINFFVNVNADKIDRLENDWGNRA